MQDCIFNGHCFETMCDKACPTLVETTYLLERNGLASNNRVFKDTTLPHDKVRDVLDDCEGKLMTYQCKDGNSILYADLFTYVAICLNWEYSQLHCNVYNLRFGKYMEDLRRSWTSRSPLDDIEYQRIWTEKAKILIVSGLDFVDFKDFECQTLLNLIQERQVTGLTTIFICKPLHQLVSTRNSVFFTSLLDMLKQGVFEL